MGCREIKEGRLRTRILCSFYKEAITFVSLTHHLGGLVAKSCPTLAILWTVAHQAPLSMGFSRQEYWNGLLFPSPGDLLDLGIESGSPAL